MITSAPQQRMARRASQGFTLIEVMIVVAILGILAAVVFPNYVEYVNKSKRTEARALLLQNAQHMQRFYAVNYRYDKTLNGATDPVLPYTKSPANGTALYNISLTAVSRGAYVLSATPTSADSCGTLTLSNTGVRGISTSTDSAEIAKCWK